MSIQPIVNHRRLDLYKKRRQLVLKHKAIKNDNSFEKRSNVCKLLDFMVDNPECLEETEKLDDLYSTNIYRWFRRGVLSREMAQTYHELLLGKSLPSF